MNQQSATTQAQATRIAAAISVSTALAVSSSRPANVGITGSTPMFTSTGENNNCVGQYYLRFLRHHSTRASPVTVQWLLQNYETAEGVSLPRSTLYSHYLNHCLDYWLEPMNPASFGKLIRSVFVGLRTRRLGTRMTSSAGGAPTMVQQMSRTRLLSDAGGIFIKPEISGPSTSASAYCPLAGRTMSLCLPTMAKPRAAGFSLKDEAVSSGFATKTEPMATSSASIWRPFDIISGVIGKQKANYPQLHNWQSAVKLEDDSPEGVIDGGLLTSLSERGTDNEDRLHFGSGDNGFNFPSLMVLCQLVGIDLSPESSSFPVDLSVDASGSNSNRISNKEMTERGTIVQFVKLYERHCAEVYEAIITPQLERLRNIWQRFWSPCDTLTRDLEQRDLNNVSDGETRLNKMQLALINSRKCLCQFVELADRALYQTLLEIIISDSLKSMPPSLLHTVRVMVKRIQHCLRSAIRHLSPTLINCKLTAISGFIKGLRRVIGLAHLSRAVVQILNSTERLEQMRLDICKLDLENIEAQGSWASDCLPSWTLFTEQSLLANFASPPIALDSGCTSTSHSHVDAQLLASHSRQRRTSSPNTVNMDSMQTDGYFGTSTGCSFTMVQLHLELQHLLTANASLACWIAWLDRVVVRGLAGRVTAPKRANAARQLMLVWNYYSSLLIRELTLRSAPSFGSCYLLRMLCDEYLSFRLEQIAASPLLTLPSKWNTSATGPHAPGGCVCLDGASSNHNTTVATIDPGLKTAKEEPNSLDHVTDDEIGAAATLLTTFNSREEEERGVVGEGSKDLDADSSWEQASSGNIYGYFDGVQSTTDSLTMAPCGGITVSDPIWSSLSFSEANDSCSNFPAIGAPPFAEELISEDTTTMTTSELTPTPSPKNTPPPPPVFMLPVFPDQFLQNSSPPSQKVKSTEANEESRQSSSTRVGSEKGFGDFGGTASNRLAAKINRKSVCVTIGKEEAPVFVSHSIPQRCFTHLSNIQVTLILGLSS
ncbi:hypothetical protein Aperf_G00000045332 [Anoplocephala perfoliata]